MPAKAKPKRPILSRGRNVCSVEDRKMSARKARRGEAMTIGVEPRAPIGRKFTRTKHSDQAVPKSTKSAHLTLYEQWLENVTETGLRSIRKEYLDLIKGYVPNGSQNAWEADKNYEKNRYEDIRLLDETRVKLKRTPDNEDYIHASYVNITEGMVFICAQGPLPNTIQEFWIMIIQEQIKVVLQLCKFIESGKEQCADYLPESRSEWREFGAVRVRLVEKPTPVPQLKKVIRTTIEASYDDTKHEVLHLMYEGWPDHFVPDSVPICREVRALVNKSSEKKPVLVHCSAGIGRTGTYAAAEMAIQKIKKNEPLVISDIAKNLRDQRMGSVQNDQQYIFIFRIVIEVLVSENLLTKTQQVIEFIKEYDDLIARKRNERARKSVKSSKSK